MPFTHAVILDDHLLFANSFSLLLKDIFGFKKIKLCRSFQETEETLLSCPDTDYFFVDYLMPETNTFNELTAIRCTYPDLNIVVVSSINNVNIVSKLARMGIQGFLSKNAQNADIVDCITSIQNKQLYISKEIKKDVVFDFLQEKRPTLFSLREHEILCHIANGDTIEETAKKLNLSPSTVITHRKNMMRKMEVNSVTKLLKEAMDMGLL